jgi:putative oxidoreductase
LTVWKSLANWPRSISMATERARVHTSPEQQAWGITVLRVMVGTVFMAHGLQKALLTGVAGVAEFMGQAGIPLPMTSALVVTGVETLCGLALVAGFLTRWAAIPLAIVMLVATAIVHLPAGFFLPNGFEYALTLLAACVSLSLLGSGAFALDNVVDVEHDHVKPAVEASATRAA